MVCALLSMKASQYVEETVPDSRCTSISFSTSLYDDENDAGHKEYSRRYRKMTGRGRVRITHVRKPPESGLRALSRQEMLSLMLALNDDGIDLMTSSG
jgi:hypothetical protein